MVLFDALIAFLEKQKKRIAILLPILLLILVGLDLWISHSVYLDADMASELILANTLWKEKSILTNSWFYSTELRVFNTQLIFAPLFGMFSSWRVIRVVGTMILVSLMAVCFLYFCKNAGLTFGGFGVLLIIAGMCEQYYSYVIKGAGYIPYIAVTYFSLALCLRLCKGGWKRPALVLLVLLSFLSGLGGLRQILCLYLPFVVASVSFFLWIQREHLVDFHFHWSGFEASIVGLSLVTLLGSCAGYLVNAKVLSQHFSYLKYDELHYLPISFERLELLLNGWREMLGYTWSGNVFTLFGLISMGLFVLYFGLVILSILYIFVKWKSISQEHLFLFWFSLVTCILCSLVVLFLEMEFSSRHLLPSAACLLIPILVFLENYSGKPIRWLAVIGLVAVAFWGCTLSLYSVLRTHPVPDDVAIVEVLREHDSHEGVTSFWIGNTLTELSDGEIQSWCYSVYNEGYIPNTISYWLQLTAHGKMPESKNVFLAMTREQSEMTAFKPDAALNVIYESPDHIVYLFPDHQAMVDSVIQ